jgi:hypothetical protein
MGKFSDAVRSSILGLLGNPAPPGDSTLLDQTEAIRYAMLQVMGDDAAADFPAVVRRVRYADDIQGLWFLRSDLMGALSRMYGEHKARDVMEAINEMFEGFIPDAKNSSRFNTLR